jgi:hypothetical protein
MSVNNFEEHTNELNPEELKLVPLVMNGFRNYTESNPIKAPDVVSKMNQYLAKNGWKIKLTQPRLRKIVNHIRTNGLQPLIATSKGYFVSNDKKVIEEQILSLQQRANSIQRCADGLGKFIK